MNEKEIIQYFISLVDFLNQWDIMTYIEEVGGDPGGIVYVRDEAEKLLKILGDTPPIIPSRSKGFMTAEECEAIFGKDKS